MKVIRLPAVKLKTGLSTSSIYRLVDKGLFPAPIVVGDSTSKNPAVGWLEDEIDGYIEAACAKRTNKLA